MNKQMRVAGSVMMQAERAALQRAAEKALAKRRASGEILTYELEGWVVQEHPGGDIAMNIRRVEGRAMQGGRWIEPETIQRRVAGSLGNLPAAIIIADRAVVLDNSGSSHRQVLGIERDRVLFEAPDPPRWLAGQMPRIAAELERVGSQSRLTPSLARWQACAGRVQREG